MCPAGGMFYLSLYSVRVFILQPLALVRAGAGDDAESRIRLTFVQGLGGLLYFCKNSVTDVINADAFFICSSASSFDTTKKSE